MSDHVGPPIVFSESRIKTKGIPISSAYLLMKGSCVICEIIIELMTDVVPVDNHMSAPQFTFFYLMRLRYFNIQARDWQLECVIHEGHNDFKL